MITLFWSSAKENCCLLRSQHKGKLGEKFRSITCRVYYYLFRDWNLWHLFRGMSIFSLLEKSFLSHPWKLHGIAPHKPHEKNLSCVCGAVMDELTLGPEYPSSCCCSHHSCCIFCLQSWNDQLRKKKKSIFTCFKTIIFNFLNGLCLFHILQ